MAPDRVGRAEIGAVLTPFPRGGWLKGFYVGAYTAVYGVNDFDFIWWRETLELGYQLIFRGGFTIVLGGGVRFDSATGFSVPVNVALGYAF